MHWDLVPVHLPVDGEAVVSVSTRGGGGGGCEALALVRIICPYALITFPPINWNNKKTGSKKDALKLSPLLINGKNTTREVISATKGAIPRWQLFVEWKKCFKIMFYRLLSINYLFRRCFIHLLQMTIFFKITHKNKNKLSNYENLNIAMLMSYSQADSVVVLNIESWAG